eukprot:8376188-Ditylum_brightwellii.AAC.1
MFKRITNLEGTKVHVYSQPTPDSEEEKPWVVSLDDFMTEEEIDRILEYGQQTGYQQSGKTFNGNHQGQKTTQARTSENSWCGFQIAFACPFHSYHQFGDTCFDDPIVEGLLKRVSDVTGVPLQNFNEMQILRYQKNQYYKTHGDYIVEDAARRTGGRILTFFLYLSDVIEGGETEFPRLDPPIKVTPKKGTALLWSNVLNQNPHEEDIRMWHQALPVIKGTKYAANLWIHIRDVRTPNEYKCYG